MVLDLQSPLQKTKNGGGERILCQEQNDVYSGFRVSKYTLKTKGGQNNEKELQEAYFFRIGSIYGIIDGNDNACGSSGITGIIKSK